MRLPIGFAAAAACVGLAACGGGSSNPPRPPAGSQYEPRVEATILKACEVSAGGAPSAGTKCKCVLAHLEARVSQKTLQDTERALVQGKATVPQWLRDAATACKNA